MRIRFLPLLILLASPVLLSGTAHAERRNPLDGQPAVRHRFLLRKLRFEVTPQFITSINQDYKHAFGFGVNLAFHITDWMAVGIHGAYTLNTDTALEDRVRDRLPPSGMYTTGPQPSVDLHDAHVLALKTLVSLNAQLTPFYGKIAFFSALFVNYDLYVNGGLGLVNYTSNPAAAKTQLSDGSPDPNLQSYSFAGWKMGGQFGVGAHVYFKEWFGIQLELRDYIVSANPGGLDTNGDRKLTAADASVQNNLFFGFGFTFMLPPTARISP